MILELSEGALDRATLADTVAAMIDKATAEDSLVSISEKTAQTGAYHAELWSLLAEDLGACAVLVPVQAGGSGASFAEAAVILEQLGAALACVPFLSTLVAEMALTACADNSQALELLETVASGRATATIDLFGGGIAAELSDGTWMLSGSADFVIDGASADFVLVPVAGDHPDRHRLFLVDGSLLSRTRMDGTDLTRQLAAIRADSVPATLIGENVDLAGLRDIALIAQGCEQLGVAKRSLHMAVDFAKQRIQFGRVIGSFQAVKHKLAEVAVAVELAESAVAHGVWAIVEGDDAARAQAACIVAMACSDAALTATAENIQVHGGIGFTWEHPAHLYYRRALSSAVLLGAREDHADRLFASAAERTAR